MNKSLVWPVAGGVIGTLVATIHLEAGLTAQAGIAAWCAAMVLVLILSAHSIGARIGAFLAGLFVVQFMLIAAERRLKVRRWPSAAGRAWTLAVLTIASPLFVEPALPAH